MKSEGRGFMSRAASSCEQEAKCSDTQDDDDDISSSQSEQIDGHAAHVKPVEDVPWHRSQEDETPVISERFAENKFDHVSRDIAAKMRNESLPSIVSEHFGNKDSMKSSAIVNIFISPDEKLNQINKRLTALKKRLQMLEDHFEKENGYRPSPNVKLNDRNMKNAIAEIHKLRKDKQILKADPMAAVAFKAPQTGDGGQSKIMKMQDTIVEIGKVSETNFAIQ